MIVQVFFFKKWRVRARECLAFLHRTGRWGRKPLPSLESLVKSLEELSRLAGPTVEMSAKRLRELRVFASTAKDIIHSDSMLLPEERTRALWFLAIIRRDIDEQLQTKLFG